MAESSGFFPDVNGDREYTTDFLALWIASIIGNGVYDGDLAVASGSNMQIIVPSGRAWINGYHYRNDGNLALAIDNADGVLNRKDTVVLRWDINTRSITAQVLKGTPASTAAAPAIVRTVEQYDLKLAEISIPAGTTAITQSLITDTRLDKSVCGIVTGVVQQVDTTTLYQQIQNDLARFRATNESDFSSWSDTQKASFNTWLSGLKNALDADTAGHLQNEIDSLTSNKANKTDIPVSLKNPNALTVTQGYGGDTGAYDGSAAKTVSIPKITITDTDPGSTYIGDGCLVGVYKTS
jgi:hypothetical protein